jgi:hypothetical protein
MIVTIEPSILATDKSLLEYVTGNPDEATAFS